ncbi:unnamed protein product [Orchesella dallaii]|uniref:Uncharacterized protein n=1 Tax=Orchesella dallaii TaxID=48710 RepID=A0ABP1PJC8_9HEXA
MNATLVKKLASSRGQGDSAIIAPQQHLLSKEKQKNEAERKDENWDNHVAEINEDIQEKIKRLNISESVEEKLQRPNTLSSKVAKSPKSPFESCKEFLAKAGQTNFSRASSQDHKFTSSRSVSNLKSCLVEEKGCLTDVHCGSTGRKLGEDLLEDEVEIVSLLEEQIPRYKLRADTITQFSGYANEDFVGIPYPVLTDYSPVTPEQAYLTLGYFCEWNKKNF